MVRPTGQFKQNQNLLLEEIKRLCLLSPEGVCKETSMDFGAFLKVTTTQVQNYLKALENSGEIIRNTSKLTFNPTTKKKFRVREIRLGISLPKAAASSPLAPSDLVLRVASHQETLKQQAEERSSSLIREYLENKKAKQKEVLAKFDEKPWRPPVEPRLPEPIFKEHKKPDDDTP